jgi:hypothetical protein
MEISLKLYRYVILTLVGLGLSGGTVIAQSEGGSVIPEEAVVDLNPNADPSAPIPMLYTQDFELQDCTFKPTGINPFYDPLIPGSTSVSEATDKVDDAGNPVSFRKEYRVLDETEKFNLEGIGSFEAAVIEEREILGGKLIQISLNWYAICQETNSIYAVGEDSFELDPDTGEVISTEGTWRAGTVNELGEIAIPSLSMPGTVLLGSRYIFDGAPGVAFGGAEIVGHGLKTVDGKLTTVRTEFYDGEADIEIPITAAVGDFSGCIQVEEISQNSETRIPDLTDVTNKVWCPGVGLVFDTSDGALVESNAL